MTQGWVASLSGRTTSRKHSNTCLGLLWIREFIGGCEQAQPAGRGIRLLLRLCWKLPDPAAHLETIWNY